MKSDLIAIAQTNGISTDTSLRIIEASVNPIREIKNKDLVLGLISSELSVISMAYGGRKEVTEQTLDVCVDMIANQFSKLAVKELKIAFELCASGKISVNPTIWGGQFDATLLGKVLWGYVELRNRLMQGYQNSLPVVEIVQESHRKTDAIKSMKKNYFNLVEHCKNYSSEQSDSFCQSSLFPFYWLESGKANNYQDFIFLGKEISISEKIKEKLVIRTREFVKNFYLAEFSNEDSDKRNKAKQEIENINAGRKTEDYVAKCKSVFNRFVIMYLILRPLVASIEN